MKGDDNMNDDKPIIDNCYDHKGEVNENFIKTVEFLHDVVRRAFPPKNDRIKRVDD